MLAFRIAAGALTTAALALAQGRGAASPASQAPPKTVTPQTYPAAQIKAGEETFVAQCGFCHGRDAAGGETGPDLTRSSLVATDTRGDMIKPLVRDGRVAEGMPAFKLSDAEINSIVAYIHDQKTQAEGQGGGRRTVQPADLAVGNAADGRSYFNGAGKCSSCHSPTGDLAGVATRYQGLALLQRMLYPTGKPSLARGKVTLTLPSGETEIAPLAAEDEFSITTLDANGARHAYEKSAVKFKIDDPLSAHFDQLGKYSDAEMHNVFAYVDTLK